jgi:methylmalonyl-CoA mutase C-terminal domain/subunit
MAALKILLAKPGLDGHDVGVKVLAHALMDNGFQVVYSGLRKTVKEIALMAAEQKVDLIGLSILSGTHVELCRAMRQELQEAHLSTAWIVGGNIPDEDIDSIMAFGASAAFPTGTTIEHVLAFCRTFSESHRLNHSTSSQAR